MITDLVGTLAAVLTTASFIPQTIKTIRTRDTAGISFLMYAMFAVGVLCWLVYGVLIDAALVIAANAVTLALASTILYMKARAVMKDQSARGLR